MKNLVSAFIILYLIWIILVGNLTLYTLISGVFVSAACILFTKKFMPLKAINDVRFSKLFLHGLFLIKEIYRCSFIVIRLIFIGAKADVVRMKTNIRSEFLQAILINSITLTPGSIPLNLDEKKDELLVLVLAKDEKKTSPKEKDEILDPINLERYLIRAQKTEMIRPIDGAADG